MNLAGLLDHHADWRPEASATVGPGAARTWGALRERVARAAGGLRARGVARGDPVALLAPNGIAGAEAHLALAWLGALVVPLNTRLSPAELGVQLRDVGARCWLVADTLAALADQAAPDLPRVVLGEAARAGEATWERLIAGATPAAEPEPVEPGHPLGVFYTGGTTGVPRGVVLTHLNLWANAANVARAFGLTAGDVHLHAAPMFHLADLGFFWALVFVGGAHAFLPRWEPGACYEALARDRATTTVLAPTMVADLLRAGVPARDDLATWRRLVYGGAPIGEELLRRAMAALPCALWQGYGQTEATHTVCVLSPDDLAGARDKPERLRACGRPIAGVQVRVAGEDLRPAPPGAPGEVLVRGPTVMQGYLNRPEETAAALAGGWLHTGDVATVDADGFVTILDRKKDVIVTGAENVFSAEVEAVLASHPDVAEAAVIAVPDERWGERVHAVVVRRAGARVTPEALAAHCRRLLGGFKVPRSFEFRDDLPRTPSGKIQKSALRKPYWRGRSRNVS